MKKILFFLCPVFFIGWWLIGLIAYAENVTSGTNAGARLTTGDANVFLGESAGAYTTTGVGNVFIGYSPGNRNTTGSRNIYLGYLSGMGLTGSDRFVLRNYPYSTVLYAHMDSQKVAINATNALGYNFYVSGTAKITGATTYSTVTADSITSGRFLSSLTGGANNAAISPSGDKDTGLYWLAATGNRIGLTAKGTQVALFDSAGTGVTTGTAAAPSFHNLNDRDTGLYWLTATGNRLGVTAKGASVAIFDSAGVIITGIAKPDTVQATNIVATGYNITDGTIIGRASATITGTVTADTLHAVNAVDTGYHITDGAGIVRGGLTVTGTATADTVHSTNIVATGYGILNGVGIFRSGTTTTGIATVDTLHSTNTVSTGYNITDGVGIIRSGLTVTGITTSDTLHATNSVDTGYHITNGASIVRGGETVTGIATSDTVHTTNFAATGYGILNGVGIFRSGTTTTGIATVDTLHSTNTAFTGYAIVDGATILRGTVSAALDSANNAANSLAQGDIAGLTDNLALRLLKTALAESLATNYGIQETGIAWVDSSHVKAVAIAGTNLQDPLMSLDQWHIARAPADSSGTGIITIGTAGERLERGDLVRKHSDGKFYRSDADSVITMPGMYLATEAGVADASLKFLLSGYFRYDSRYAFTVGGIVYASTTTGTMSTTAPAGAGDQVQAVGIAESADVIDFRPSLVLVEIAP